MPEARLKQIEQITTELETRCGYYITVSDLARYLGCVWRTAEKILSDVPFVSTGNRRRWRSSDVARKLAL